ncbi:hypothetical protein Hdeb2414_s1207g00991721 [Helianthus debilis subsp. tardiflorus]
MMMAADGCLGRNREEESRRSRLCFPARAPPPLSSDSSDRRWRWVTTGCPLAPQP